MMKGINKKHRCCWARFGRLGLSGAASRPEGAPGRRLRVWSNKHQRIKGVRDNRQDAD